MNSYTNESRLWRRLFWFEAIFPKKNASKLLEMCYLSVKRSGKRASDTVLFISENNDWLYNQSVGTSFFTMATLTAIILQLVDGALLTLFQPA